MAIVIDGKKIAARILDDLKLRPIPKKALVAVLAGGDAPARSFVAQKRRTAEALGLDFRLRELPRDVSAESLAEEIAGLAASPQVGGIIIQLPLPGHIERDKILDLIPREKDADVLGGPAFALFSKRQSPVAPPAVGAVREALDEVRFPLPGKTVAVVGSLGYLVGRPLVAWLKWEGAPLLLLEKGDDLAVLHGADLVISGTGVPGLIRPAMLKEGAGVIDFGYSEKDGKMQGDFDPESLLLAEQKLLFYTPTPGGTGPILVAKLLENFYILNGYD